MTSWVSRCGPQAVAGCEVEHEEETKNPEGVKFVGLRLPVGQALTGGRAFPPPNCPRVAV